MKYEEFKTVVNGIVENEFGHVSSTKEKHFTDTNADYIKKSETSELLHKALEEGTTEEQQRLIGELEDSISSEWIEICRFYFREGLRAGLTNLNFLKEIDDIGLIL